MPAHSWTTETRRAPQPGGFRGSGCIPSRASPLRGCPKISIFLGHPPHPQTVHGETMTDSRLEEVLDSDAVRRRLATLGIPIEVLLEAVRDGHHAGDFATAAHPRNYRGILTWGEVTAALRKRLVVLGWSLDDRDNIARVISPDGEVTVVAISGNRFTGLRGEHEQLRTRRPRGSAGIRIICRNGQRELALDESLARSRNRLVDGGGTWFLLYNRAGDLLRSELSYAKSVDDQGGLIDWRERLILPDIDLSRPPAIMDSTPNTQPDVEVHVSRRG